MRAWTTTECAECFRGKRSQYQMEPTMRGRLIWARTVKKKLRMRAECSRIVSESNKKGPRPTRDLFGDATMIIAGLCDHYPRSITPFYATTGFNKYLYRWNGTYFHSVKQIDLGRNDDVVFTYVNKWTSCASKYCVRNWRTRYYEVRVLFVAVNCSYFCLSSTRLKRPLRVK